MAPIIISLHSKSLVLQLNIQTGYSFYLDLIAGIPEDETLLNPVKTEEAISSWKLIDYSKEENQNSFQALFSAQSINDDVSEDGKYTITGKLNKEIEHDVEFILYLAFPHMIIEQQVTRKGFIELFTFTGIESEGEFNWIKEEVTTPTNKPNEGPSIEEVENKTNPISSSDK